jgi:hypothetical protein
MKKDIKAWAIKLRGRSFYLDPDGTPYTWRTRADAELIAEYIKFHEAVKAEPVRVRVRIEEIE